MPFMVIPIAKNYELSGIEGYTCQTQAKTHAIVWQILQWGGAYIRL